MRLQLKGGHRNSFERITLKLCAAPKFAVQGPGSEFGGMAGYLVIGWVNDVRSLLSHKYYSF
jgi:hypothetical protein